MSRATLARAFAVDARSRRRSHAIARRPLATNARATTTEAKTTNGTSRAFGRFSSDRARHRSVVARAMNAPTPETEEEEGSVLDFPEEYVRAVPSRRPDVFPDLKEQKTPMPKPMPGDPEAPDEEEEEKERKENPGEPGEKPEEEENEENEKKKKKKKKKDDEEEEKKE